MTNRTYDFQKLGEYVVKIENTLPLIICQSLSANIFAKLDFEPDRLEKISETLSKIYPIYKDEIMPRIHFADDLDVYYLELDYFYLDSNEKFLLNSGGEGRSQRFLTFLFVTESCKEGIDFQLLNSSIESNLKTGDLLIYPPYYDNQIAFQTKDKQCFNSVSLHACLLEK